MRGPATNDSTASIRDERRGLSAARNIVPASIFAVSVTAAFWPLVSLHLRHLWARPHYAFWPLLVAAWCGLFVVRWPRRTKPSEPGTAWTTFALLGAGLLLLAVAISLYSPWLAMVAAILALGGILRHLAGRAFRRQFFGLWLLLWLLVPPPFGLDTASIEQLQNRTTAAAGYLLDSIGVLHLRAGNIIEMPGHDLMVRDASNGVRWMYVMFTVAAVYAVWRRRKFIPTVLLLCFAVIHAGIANLLRVATVGWAYARWGISLDTGWEHDALTACAFLVALTLLISSDRLVAITIRGINFSKRVVVGLLGEWLWDIRQGWSQRFGRRLEDDEPDSYGDSEEDRAGPQQTQGRRASQARPRRPAVATAVKILVIFCWVVLITSFTSLAALQVYIQQTPVRPSLDIRDAIAGLSERSLPETVGPWTCVGFSSLTREPGHPFGENSKIWSFTAKQYVADFSVDFTFDGWHELARCYQNQGWNVLERTVVTDPGQSAADDSGYVLIQMDELGGRNALVVCSQYDRTAAPLLARYTGPAWIDRGMQKLRKGPVWQLFSKTPTWVGDPDTTTYQIQVFVMSNDPLDREQRDEVISQFKQLEATLLAAWRSQEG